MNGACNPMVRIPMELRVWDFTLAVSSFLQSEFGSFGRAADAFGITSGTPEYDELIRKFERVMMAHRLMPWYVAGALPSFDESDGTVDGASALPALTEAIGLGLNSCCMPIFDDWPWPDCTTTNRAQALSYLRGQMAYLDMADFASSAFYYAIDEPNSAEWRATGPRWGMRRIPGSACW